jgi:hypothetical protein
VPGDEILRAVDCNLIAESGTFIDNWTTTIPQDACAAASFVTFNRPVGGVDCTQRVSVLIATSNVVVMLIAVIQVPDFDATTSHVSSGYFCNDPTSTQKDAVGGSVLIAQFQLRRTTKRVRVVVVGGVVVQCFFHQLF